MDRMDRMGSLVLHVDDGRCNLLALEPADQVHGQDAQEEAPDDADQDDRREPASGHADAKDGIDRIIHRLVQVINGFVEIIIGRIRRWARHHSRCDAGRRAAAVGEIPVVIGA